MCQIMRRAYGKSSDCSSPNHEPWSGRLLLHRTGQKSATYNRGTAHELRHTVGTRVFRPIGKGLDYNWEPNYQWGSFGSASIRAWSVSTDTLSSSTIVTGGRIQRRRQSGQSAPRNLQLTFPAWRMLYPRNERKAKGNAERINVAPVTSSKSLEESS